MKYIIIICTVCAIICTGCAKMIPGLMDELDDMVSENAVEVNVNKEAMQKDTDVDVSVKITNKDPVVSK